jgi:hypothetical protein
MTITENIIEGYWSREQAMETDIVEWRKRNRGISKLLDYAEKLVNNGEHN